MDLTWSRCWPFIGLYITVYMMQVISISTPSLKTIFFLLHRVALILPILRLFYDKIWDPISLPKGDVDKRKNILYLVAIKTALHSPKFGILFPTIGWYFVLKFTPLMNRHCLSACSQRGHRARLKQIVAHVRKWARCDNYSRRKPGVSRPKCWAQSSYFRVILRQSS